MTAPAKPDMGERKKALPGSLRAERLTKMPLLCRFGWHQWMMTERFSTFGHARYQATLCARCHAESQRRVGWEGRDA